MSKRITKTSAVELPNQKKSYFLSTITKIEEPNDELEITKALKEANRTADEEKLVQLELEKPFAARNPALMRKYSYSDPKTTIDKYPNVSETDKYKITITAPEEGDIRVTKRPKPYYIAVEVKYQGNDFIYQFPISRATEIEGAAVYKLDGFQIFLDQDFNAIDELSDYGLYQALLDFKHGNENRAYDIADIFLRYGISQSDDDVNKDFRVKGHHFSVSSSKLRATIVKEPKGEPKSKNKFNIISAPFIAEEIKFMNGYEEEGRKVLKNVLRRLSKGENLLGLSADDIVGPQEVIIDQVYSNRKYIPGLDNTWIMLDALGKHDADGKDYIYITVINRSSSAKKDYGYNGQASGLNKLVVDMNKKTFGEYVLINSHKTHG